MDRCLEHESLLCHEEPNPIAGLAGRGGGGGRWAVGGGRWAGGGGEEATV